MTAGKCYKMLVTRNLNNKTETYTVFFRVEKLVDEKTFYSGFEGVLKVYSNDRITMERNHKTSSSKIGTLVGNRLVPVNPVIYTYSDLEEIKEEDYKRKTIYAKYGL